MSDFNKIPFNRKPAINIVGADIGWGNNNSNGASDPKDFCPDHNVRLALRKADNKRICPECGWPDYSLEPPPTQAGTTTTAAVQSQSQPSQPQQQSQQQHQRPPKSKEEKMHKMREKKRKIMLMASSSSQNKDAIVRTDGGGYTMAMPSSRNPLGRRTDDLDELNSRLSDDPDLRRIQERGGYFTYTETNILTGPGVWETVSSDELHRRRREDDLYDNRYEGRSEAYPEDPSNYSTSGLNV